MNGPDWSDVILLMGALEVLHECRVSLTVTTAGQGHNGQCAIGVSAVFDVVPGSERVSVVSTTITWPNGYSRNFEGEIFNALYVLDFMIGEVYQQRFLPGVDTHPALPQATG
jgi:hypothetical protein